MESTTEIVSTTVDHPVEVKSEGIVEPNATATITTSSITIERTNQSIDDENIEENVTSLIKQTIVISPEPVGSLSSSSAPETLPPQTVNESNLINGDSIKDQPLQVIKETVVTVVKDEIRKVVTEETKPTEALPTSSPIIEILEEPDDASLKVDETPKEESTVTSTDEVIEPVLTETVVKRGNNTDKAEAESTEQPSVQDLSDAKYPQRPPPPKLSEQGKRTQTLSTSPSNDVITNGVGQNQQHQQQHQPQQQQQHHNQEATPEYKRPSFKSNLKHAFSNIRKSFKRKDQTPNPNDFQPSQKSTHRNNYHRNNNNNNVDNDYHHGDVHKTSEELQESLSNVQSFDSVSR
ncbi:unnamed protein product [Trichobilharzia regenti]|nr:unnamed protein product [Trichobilharzia regenti]